MSQSTATVERRVERALRERAASMPSVVEALPLPVPSAPRRSRRPVVWAVAAAAVVLAVATVVITKPFGADSKPVTPATSTAPAPPSTTTSLPAPSGDAGREVPLAPADTEDTQFLIRMRRRSDPSYQPIVVQSPGRAPILVTPGCMTIAVAPPDGTGYQGACVPNPATSFVGTIDTGGNLGPTSKAYGAWVQLPAGTAYVTYSHGPERWWQRPLDGITYTVVDAIPKYGAEPLVARAFDATGRQLAEISRTPIRVPDGSWSWL